MAIKMILAAFAVAAVAIGLALPGPRLMDDDPSSQIAQIEVHR